MAATEDLLVRIRAVLTTDATSGGKIADQLKKEIRDVFNTLKTEAASVKSTVGAERVKGTAEGVATAGIQTARELQAAGRITDAQFRAIATTLRTQVEAFNKELAAIAAANKRIRVAPIPVAGGTTGADSPYYVAGGTQARAAVREASKTLAAAQTAAAGGDDDDVPRYQAMLDEAQANAAALKTLTDASLGYSRALADATAAQAEIDAQMYQLLAAEKGYAQSLATSTASQAQIKAQTDTLLAHFPGYAQSLASSALAQAQIKAQQQNILAYSQPYAEALASSAISQAKITAAQKYILADSPVYAAALAQGTAAQARITAAEQRLLVVYPGYAQSLADATVSKAQIRAQEQLILAANGTYITALTDSAVAQASISAQQKSQLSRNAAYIDSLANSAISQASITAQQKQILATSATYISSLTSAALSQAQISAQQKAILATSTAYINTLTSAAVSQAQIDAAQKGQLAGSAAYIAALTNSAISQASINAQQKQQLANSSAYVGSLVTAAAAQSQINAQQAEQLAANNAYIGTQVRITAARAALAASEAESLQFNTAYANALARSTAAKAAIAAVEQNILASSTTYAASLAQSAIAKAQIAATESGILASSQAYIDAQAARTVSQKILAGEEATAIAGNQAYVQALAEATVAKKLLAAAEQQAVAATLGPLGEQRLGLAAAGQKLSSAKIRAAEIASPEYEQAVQLEAANNARIAAVKAAAAATEAAIAPEVAGVTAANAKLQAEKNRIIETMTLLEMDQAEIAAKAKSLAAENTFAKVKGERTALEQRLAAQTAAQTAAFGGTPPGDGRRGGGIDFFGGARSTIKYGLPSIALFGALRGITQSVKEAAELERIFNQIERQFDSFEESEIVQPGDFDKFRAEVMAIARDTGQAASEVANVGFQLQGAFGGNTTKSLVETRNAIEAVRVTGLELREVIDAFTALTQNFKDGGITIENVSDKALGLQERFGVLAKETISFASDLAPVAAAANINVDALQALGAVAQKYSGRTGTALAEAFGRIIPQIQGNAVKFVQFFQSIPALAGNVGALTEAFAAGDILAVIQQLGAGYGQLSDAQQNYIADLLGGRREAQAIIGVLENYGELQRELKGDIDDTGKTTQYLNDLQETLAQRLARVGEELSQLGVRIYDAGLKDFLEDLLAIGSGLVDVLTTIMDLVSAIAGVGGGSLGTILGTIAEGVLLYKGAGILGRGASRLLGRGATATGAHFAGQTAATAGGAALLGGRAAGGALTAATRQFQLSRGLMATTNALAGRGALTVGQGAKAFGSSLLAGAKAIPFAASATIIATGYSMLSSSLRKSATESQQKTLGPDLRGSDKELQELISEFGADRNEVDALVAKILQEGGTWDDVEKALVAIGKSDASGVQQLRGRFGLGGDRDQNIEAAKLFVEELRQRDLEVLERLATEENLTEELGKLLADRPNLVNVFAASSGALEGESDLAVGQAVLQGAINNLRAGRGGAAEQDVIALLLQAQGLVETRTQQEIEKVESLEFLTSGEADQLYQQGLISFNAYKKAIENELSILQSVSTGTPQDTETIATLQRQLKKLISDNTLAAIEQLSSLEELGGTFDPAVGVERYKAALSSGNLSREGRKEATEKIISLLGDLHQYQIDQTDSVAEQIELYRTGIKIPDVARIEILSQTLQTTNTGFQQIIDDLFGGFSEQAAAFTTEVARVMLETGATLRDALRIVLEAQRDAYLRLAASAKKALRPSKWVPARGADKAAQNFADAAKATQDQIDALGNVDLEEPPPIPTTTGADPKRATELAKQAAEEANRTARELAEARLDYMLALIENDPIKAAVNAQQQADLALQFAETEADRISAQAARVRADRQVRDAMYAIHNSTIELLIAMADAAGDAVEAAQLNLDLQKQQLNQLIAEGAGEAAINAKKGEVFRAEANVRDTLLSDKLGYYQYLHDVGKITNQQLIGYLETLMKIPDLTEKQRQDLERQIYGLKQELGQDFQFNLPSNLALPTLYEVRRLNQTGGAPSQIAGAGYADNRQIIVNFTANNTADAEGIATQIIDAFARPTRFGTAGRPY